MSNTFSIREIALSKGLVALVDATDYEWLSQYSWCADGDGYAVCHVPRLGGQRTQYMHRLIMGLGFGDQREVDHVNHVPADNRRENMRICSRGENQHNRISRIGSSRFKGVSWEAVRDRWRAGIKVSGKQINLGNFAIEEEAARAYDVAALEYFGEFALLNFPRVFSP